MMEEEDLLSRVMSGGTQFASEGNLRIQWGVLLSTIPTAFLCRTMGAGTGGKGGTKWVGLRKDGNLVEWKAQLKAAKEREEAEMRDERRRAKGQLQQEVNAVVSPAKRSLTAALLGAADAGRQGGMGVSESGGTEMRRQLYR